LRFGDARERSVRRTKELVKLRLMTGDTAARRAAAMAERWRNMVGSIDVVVVSYVLGSGFGGT
jgi:hypothetical protein